MLRLSETETATLAREARTVARAFARRYPRIPADDFAQESWAAMLSKVGDYRPDVGPLGAYLHAIASTACQRFAWRSLLLTDTPRRKAAGAIARERAVPVDDTAAVTLPDDTLPADSALETLEQREALSRLIGEHLAEGELGRAVLSVLSGESRSAEAARDAGVEVSRLYSLTKRTKAAIKADRRFLAFL